MSPSRNRKASIVLYPPDPAPVPVPDTFAPTDGAVLARTFVPNCAVPVVEVQLGEQPVEFALCVPMAVIVLAPLVIVVPRKVIAYPKLAFVLALITLVPVLVAVGENTPKLTAEPVILVQFVPLVPTQNTKLSGIVPLTTIWLAVLNATTPSSIEPPVVSVLACVVMRNQYSVFEAVGFVTPPRV